jgi:hypothetical protein
MKAFFALFVIITKLYLGFRILWWIICDFSEPELHTISEIEPYLVLLLFDVWLCQQNTEFEKN